MPVDCAFSNPSGLSCVTDVARTIDAGANSLTTHGPCQLTDRSRRAAGYLEARLVQVAITAEWRGFSDHHVIHSPAVSANVPGTPLPGPHERRESPSRSSVRGADQQ